MQDWMNGGGGGHDFLSIFELTHGHYIGDYSKKLIN